MIIATLSVTPRAGQVEQLAQAFWSVLGPTQVEPGCRACGLYQEVGAPEVLHYMEEWETAEQLERHMRSARYERLLAIMETSAEPPKLEYHLIAETRGLEYLEAIRLKSSSPSTAR